ncbi:glycosyltransferase family 15, putative [Bodo saltans]|uniref:Glycosyltransferase family 15, putative n=1 Tax=Bodo saltans TaxID=75058 RepID=A0A0S4IX90_BODSA|nr:glycosyltransferase family 15, putative [Bodo saltans]|eukprot:CUG06474.1 glycosyltransferase family 15, putative [Bodo saltans]
MHGLYVQGELRPSPSNTPPASLSSPLHYDLPFPTSASRSPLGNSSVRGDGSPRLPSWPWLYRHPEDGVGSAPRDSLYGNRRAVVPLLLTSIKYHGTSLLATTLQGWILKFFIPQGNIDLMIFYDHHKVPLGELLSILRIKRRDDSTARSIDTKDLHNVILSEEDGKLLGDGWFISSYHPTFAFRVHPVSLPFPDYLAATNLTQLQDPKWMRCGCPPVCPEKRATVDYIQGTRWYTYDLFLEPIIRPYSFWIKLDVDIWLMREPKFNMVEQMIESGAIFAHTGMIYNGNGCSNELHKAIKEYLNANGAAAASEGQRWWVQDDNVYYSNFVITSMAFHLSPEHMHLAKALNEYPTGFFKYRWTDQSLFHKVFGIFFGPAEDKFLLDWTNLRCSKKAFRKGAVFYHSKGKKKSSVLRMCTDI